MTGDAPALPTRIAPLAVVGAPRARYLLERNLLVHRRTWVVLFSGFLEPVLYLVATGIGLGSLVGDVAVGDARSVPYATFVAPGLLAASAMNGAVYESTFTIYGKLRFERIYDAMLATPVTTRDIAVGELVYSLLRGALYAAGFLIVASVAGLLSSWTGVLALPAALLIGFAFGATGMAATTFMRSWQDFDLVTLVTLPLFLFSATFYPVSVYPEGLQPLVLVSPLYHGVEVVRGLMLGVFDLSLVGHVAFLTVMGTAGLVVADRRFARLLTP